MNIYAKLQKARIALQGKELKKSGHNKFAGYQYFELGDFLPAINEIFNEVGLCGMVSFDAELATLTIADTEGDGKIVFTSPMAEAQLKGCHPIQNLGAVETYSRRYLWVTAMEIVEHDALDASEPVSKPDHSEKFSQVLEDIWSAESFDVKDLPKYFDGDRDLATTFWKLHGKTIKAKK